MFYNKKGVKDKMIKSNLEISFRDNVGMRLLLEDISENGIEIISSGDRFGILYVQLGCIRVDTSKKIVLNVGDVLFIPKKSTYKISSPKKKSSFYFLTVDKSFFNGLDISISALSSYEIFRVCQLDREFSLLQNELSTKDVSYQSSVRALMILIFTNISRAEIKNTIVIDSGNYEKEGIVKMAIELMNEHFNSEISTRDIAESLNFSMSYFCHIFKEITGKTCLRYLNEIRCQRAKLMLREGRANVSGVAQRCGFNNVSYFTKIYKEIYGHSPSNDFLGQNIKE